MPCRKGALFPSEYSRSVDSKTGATVHQLTNDASINHPTYFLQSSFTADQRFVIFTSYRSGSAQLFEVGFPDGEIRQLTCDKPIHPFSPAIAPDGGIFFVRGGSVWRLNRQTLEEIEVASFGGQLGECSLSPSGDWFVAACKRSDAWGLALGATDGAETRFIRPPIAPPRRASGG